MCGFPLCFSGKIEIKMTKVCEWLWHEWKTPKQLFGCHNLHDDDDDGNSDDDGDEHDNNDDKALYLTFEFSGKTNHYHQDIKFILINIFYFFSPPQPTDIHFFHYWH